MHKRFVSLVLVLALWPAWGCRPSGDSEKLAEVDGTPITRAQVDQSAGKELRTLRQQLYRLERQKLEEYIGATLLTREGKDQGVSTSTLLEREVQSKVKPVTDEELQKFYDSNKDRIKGELEKIREQIRDYLRQQRISERRIAYIDSLRAKAKITTFLEAPPVYRVEVQVNGAPFKGAQRSPVKIVKFEDFECPFCKAVQPVLSELLKKYDGKVRLIHKDLPLKSIHPQAQLAAEAARCAGDQGKFWHYHDLLYEKVPKLGSADLKAYAKEIELDTRFFDQCLESGKHRAAVQRNLAEGASLGLTGTPAFFINGRELTGAQPLEAFAAIIDEELAKAN